MLYVKALLSVSRLNGCPDHNLDVVLNDFPTPQPTLPLLLRARPAPGSGAPPPPGARGGRLGGSE